MPFCKPVGYSHVYTLLTGSLNAADASLKVLKVQSWHTGWVSSRAPVRSVRIKILKGSCVSHGFPAVFYLNILCGIGSVSR